MVRYQIAEFFGYVLRQGPYRATNEFLNIRTISKAQTFDLKVTPILHFRHRADFIERDGSLRLVWTLAYDSCKKIQHQSPDKHLKRGEVHIGCGGENKSLELVFFAGFICYGLYRSGRPNQLKEIDLKIKNLNSLPINLLQVVDFESEMAIQ